MFTGVASVAGENIEGADIPSEPLTLIEQSGGGRRNRRKGQPVKISSRTPDVDDVVQTSTASPAPTENCAAGPRRKRKGHPTKLVVAPPSPSESQDTPESISGTPDPVTPDSEEENGSSYDMDDTNDTADCNDPADDPEQDAEDPEDCGSVFGMADFSRSDAETPIWRCIFCEYGTRDRDRYQDHLNRHENPPAVTSAPSPNGVAAVPSCGMDAAVSAAVTRVGSTFSRCKSPLACDVCGKAFRKVVLLKKHVASHLTDKRKWQCPACIYSSNRRHNVNMHLKNVHKATVFLEAESRS